MKDISQYPITDKYGATYSPWSESSPHLGEDRAAPEGTPILVNGVNIGLVGSTGKSSGNHLHVQHVKNGKVVKPETPFNLKDAVVTATGENKVRGKYVDITSGNSVYSYFHLSQINVRKGALDMYKGKSAEYWGKKAESRAVLAEEWQQKSHNRDTEIAKLKEQVSARDKIIKIHENEIARLKSQVGDSSKWETFKALVRELVGR